MLNFKNTGLALIAILILLFTSCCGDEEKKSDANVKAVEGWDNGQRVVQVTDNSGQQFLMNYLLFSTLMNSGGYNNVVHHYHSHPNTYRSTSNTFKAERPINSFTNSYRTAKASGDVYKPAKSANARQSRINTLNRAKSSYTPSKPSTTKSYSSPTRSSYRPSYRSYSSPSRSFSSSRSISIHR